MRHKKKGRKLSLERNARKGLKKALATALIKHGKIKTTEAKAKEIRPIVERMITYAKKGSLAGRRLSVASLGVASAKILFETLGPRYKDRNGGYTRVLKLPRRRSDASKMAIIEFV
ncbi:MAG TPA: 50S ribosomal protein L17 [Candidatus Paceibacterota bacterium]